MVRILVGAQYFSLPEFPDRLQEPPSLLFSEQGGTIWLHTLRISASICLPLIFHYGMYWGNLCLPPSYL